MTISIKALAGGAIAAAALLGASAPANAVLATSIRISSGIGGGDWLQIGELQVFANGVNIALASNGAIVEGSGSWDGMSTADKATDGIISTSFPDIYHSDGAGTSERLVVTFTQAFDISDIVIYGRSDDGIERNLFKYQLYLLSQPGEMLVDAGLLDARSAPYSASVTLPTTPAVPEPASWAMMICGFGLAGGALRARRGNMRIAAA
ncbi:MAG: hypothetical protein BGP16_03185 [Sphingobium sp. 66-54]|nr:MAG: hypothetical protein BGP16_03185 [Sphingobium sp. 66-54]